MSAFSRRRFVQSAGATVTLGLLAGCASESGESTPPANGDVSAGPNGTPKFTPEKLTVSAGDTVEWYFASRGHNVSAIPDHSGEVSLPDGADPFASYGTDGDPGDTEPAETTYSRTFEVPGEYTYVCVPHVRVGMIATIIVEE